MAMVKNFVIILFFILMEWITTITPKNKLFDYYIYIQTIKVMVKPNALT